MTADATHALELIATTLAAIDSMSHLPDGGANYCASVRERLADFQESIEARNSVTGSQLAAIENMNRGVLAWQK